jgi:hypothetical protein
MGHARHHHRKGANLIFINLHAHAQCEECEARIPAKVILLSTGTFGCELDSKLWQAGYAKPGQPWMTLCPKHAQRVVKPVALVESSSH